MSWQHSQYCNKYTWATESKLEENSLISFFACIHANGIHLCNFLSMYTLHIPAIVMSRWHKTLTNTYKGCGVYSSYIGIITGTVIWWLLKNIIIIRKVVIFMTALQRPWKQTMHFQIQSIRVGCKIGLGDMQTVCVVQHESWNISICNERLHLRFISQNLPIYPSGQTHLSP